MGIEALPLRVKALDAVAVERLEEVALRQLDALDQGLERPLRRLPRIRRNAVEGPAYVVGDGQRVAGEVRHRVKARVRRFPLRAAAQVLHVGERAQEFLAQIGPLRFEKRDRVGRLLGGALRACPAGWRGDVVGRRPIGAEGMGFRVVRHGLGMLS